MTRSRTIAVVVALVSIGVVFGGAASVANHTPSLGVLSKVIGVGWSWAALGIFVGAAVRRRPTIAVAVTLLAAVFGYYIADLAAGVYVQVDFADPRFVDNPANAPTSIWWSGLIADLAFWSACTLLVSWPLARIGVATRRDDMFGLLARLAVPVGAPVEMLALRLPGELVVQPDPMTIGTYWAVAGAGICASLALVALYLRRTWSRRRAMCGGAAPSAVMRTSMSAAARTFKTGHSGD